MIGFDEVFDVARGAELVSRAVQEAPGGAGTAPGR